MSSGILWGSTLIHRQCLCQTGENTHSKVFILPCFWPLLNMVSNKVFFFSKAVNRGLNMLEHAPLGSSMVNNTLEMGINWHLLSYSQLKSQSKKICPAIRLTLKNSINRLLKKKKKKSQFFFIFHYFELTILCKENVFCQKKCICNDPKYTDRL